MNCMNNQPVVGLIDIELHQGKGSLKNTQKSYQLGSLSVTKGIQERKAITISSFAIQNVYFQKIQQVLFI